METKITILKTDITKLEVDVIVNAANSSLMGGGGVDGAIHRAGGPGIVAECREIIKRQGPCEPGEAVITTAGNLPAKKLIHTVGPVWHGGKANEASILCNCYLNSLKIVLKNGFKTVAFPNISTGIYGYPKAKAAQVAIEAIHEFIDSNPGKINEIIFVCFDEENFQLYQRLLDRV